MKKHILVLEDDWSIAGVIKVILNEQGYRCITVSNCISALKVLETFKDIKLVVVDYKLFNYETCLPFTNYLHESRPDIPTLLISASNYITEHAEEIDADDFLSKPFSIENLMHKIKRLLGEVV